MASERKQRFYESRIPFERERIGAAAVYCSDGRFGDQIDELLHDCLKLPRYDRLAIPGGPACLLPHFSGFFHEQAAVSHLEFLIRFHELSSVVLIAHQDCVYYLHQLHVAAMSMEERQREDLQAVKKRLQAIRRDLRVISFFARRVDNSVRFELLDGDASA